MNENIIIDKVNKKLSSSMKTKKNPVTLSDVMVYSYPEWEKLSDDVLNREEQILIHQHADSERKQNLLTQSKVLSRSNSQLVSAVKLGIQQSSLRPGFDQLFGNRTNEFVRPGAVSSMFSPAGYLTELYRETRDLHPSSSVYNLDQRRPDLSGLVLSQENMDEEVSTLHLSNELLLRTIQSEKTRSYGEVLSMLASYRQTGGTPFHKPYDIIRQAIILQDKQFSAFAHNPDIARQIDTATLNAIRSNISPELFNILLEEITTDNADALIEKNFGEIDLSAFSRVAFLARFYDMSHDEMRSLLGVVTSQIDFIPGEQYYKNDHITLLSESSGVMNANLLHRRYVENASQFGYAELLPVSENTYFLRFTVRSGHVDSNVRVRIGTAGPGSTQIVRDQHIIPGNHIEVSVPVTLTESALEKGVTIGLTRYNGNSSGFQFASVRFNLNRMPFSVWLLKLNKLIRLYRATGLSMENLRAIIDITGPQLSINENTLRQLFWVNQFMQHYVIGRSEAMTLTGAPLSQITLKLNLTQMEQAFIRLDEREKVVTRTVSLAEMFRTLPGNSSFALAEKTAELLKSGQGSAGTSTTGLRISSGQLQAMVRLSDLNIMQDYPSELGSRRRIKQISVSLPEVAKPYQDIRAVLSYGGSVMLPRGCNAQVVSHGTNDNGQFLMHFHDVRWLPFEGIPVDDSGTLTLSFQDAVTRQKEIIEKISDIIIHIRYTIIS